MCSPATCPTCGKATWTGCGNHIEQALAGVPQSQRCQGHSKTSGTSGAASTSLFGRVFSR
jgi:hypothetical protein